MQGSRLERSPILLADSLGIDGVSRVVSVGDTVMSLDLTKSHILRRVAGLRLTVRSWDHETWNVPQSVARPMEFLVTFHWDSGTIFSRAVSAAAKPSKISFEAIDISQDSLVSLLERLQPVIRMLGHPSNCARDTSVARRARGAPKDKVRHLGCASGARRTEGQGNLAAEWRGNLLGDWWTSRNTGRTPDGQISARVIADLHVSHLGRAHQQREHRCRDAEGRRLFSDQVANLRADCGVRNIR
jgi:hypothetical protein